MDSTESHLRHSVIFAFIRMLHPYESEGGRLAQAGCAGSTRFSSTQNLVEPAPEKGIFSLETGVQIPC